MESKLQLYNRMVSARDELKPEFVEEASANVQRRLLLMEEFRTALRIGLYAAYKNEVRTEMLFKRGDRFRKEIYYPAVDLEVQGLTYFRVMRLEDLRPTAEGMMEPSTRQSRIRDMNTLDVLIVPGVVFDLGGSRMGFGRGFYDKCLEKFRGKRIALAYDFQVVPELPHSVRGRKVDWIVTEERIVKCI